MENEQDSNLRLPHAGEMLPLHHRSPASSVVKTSGLTKGKPTGLEPAPPACKADALPLRHGFPFLFYEAGRVLTGQSMFKTMLFVQIAGIKPRRNAARFDLALQGRRTCIG